MDLATLDRFRRVPMPANYPATLRTLYAPRDDVHGALLAVLGAAKRSVVIAMYGYDDDGIQAALEHLLTDEHAFVQLSLDSSQAGGVHERKLLAQWRHDEPGNSIAIGRSPRGAIMHEKLAIVDGAVVIAGSTNWSDSGERLQANELTVVADPVYAADARVQLDVIHDSMLMQMAAKAAKQP